VDLFYIWKIFQIFHIQKAGTVGGSAAQNKIVFAYKAKNQGETKGRVFFKLLREEGFSPAARHRNEGSHLYGTCFYGTTAFCVGRIEQLKNRCLESRPFYFLFCHGFYAKTHAKTTHIQYFSDELKFAAMECNFRAVNRLLIH